MAMGPVKRFNRLTPAPAGLTSNDAVVSGIRIDVVCSGTETAVQSTRRDQVGGADSVRCSVWDKHSTAWPWWPVVACSCNHAPRLNVQYTTSKSARRLYRDVRPHHISEHSTTIVKLRNMPCMYSYLARNSVLTEHWSVVTCQSSGVAS